MKIDDKDDNKFRKIHNDERSCAGVNTSISNKLICLLRDPFYGIKPTHIISTLLCKNSNSNGASNNGESYKQKKKKTLMN